MLIKLECPKCGEEMTMKTEKGFSFCNNCGERVCFGTAKSQIDPHINDGQKPNMPLTAETHQEHQQSFYQQNSYPQPYPQHAYQQPQQAYPQQNYPHVRKNQHAQNTISSAAEYTNRKVVDNYLRTNSFLSSTPVFIMALAQAVMLAVSLMIGVYYDILLGMFFVALPAIAAVVETWITYGTAKWGRDGVKTAGLTVGKVFGVIYIVLTGIIVFVELIGAAIWSTVVGWLGDGLKDIMVYIFGTDLGLKNLLSMSTNLGMIIFLVSLAPLAFWIVLQIMLNKFRDNIKSALNNMLASDIKVVFPAVLLFLYALPCIGFGILFIYYEEYLWGMAVMLQGILFAFGGVLLIVFGNTLKDNNSQKCARNI